MYNYVVSNCFAITFMPHFDYQDSAENTLNAKEILK